MDNLKVASELVKLAKQLIAIPSAKSLAKQAIDMVMEAQASSDGRGRLYTREWDRIFEMGNGDEVLELLRKEYKSNREFAKAANNSTIKRYMPPAIYSAKQLTSAENGTFKCPDCGTKVLKATGYCLKCKKKVAARLVKLARELHAKGGNVKKRMANAKNAIASGGRGVEIGIRQIELLAKELKSLAENMRFNREALRSEDDEVIQKSLLELIADF